MFSFDTKREPEKCQRFRRAGATKKGLLAPFNPKEEGYTRKNWRFTPVRREDLLTVFSGSTDLKPLSRCATAPPRGSVPARSATLSQKAALQMLFSVTIPPVKIAFGALRRARQTRNIK